MAATKFSDYVGKKKKMQKNWPQCLNTYHTILPSSEFRPLSKKVCSSDVKHCFISIFELKVMVKIGVIFMSFSNPTCHFRDTADFT